MGNTLPGPPQQVVSINAGVVFCGCVQMVKTTGGPALGASAVSPALTNSAVALLQDTLNEEEKQLWTSLGPNWTLPRSVTAGRRHLMWGVCAK